MHQRTSLNAGEPGLDEAIRQHRMGTLVVQAEPGAEVGVEQLRHEFWFGAALANQVFGGRMRAPVVRRHHLQVFDLAPTIALLDLEPHVRELHVSVLGNDPPVALPVIEYDFSQLTDDHPPVITYDIKWNPLAPPYHHVDSICPARIDKKTEKLVMEHALRAYTPREQKAVKVAAETFRPNPAFSSGSRTSLMSRRISVFPLGSPTSVVPPPTRAIGLCPALCIWARDMIGTKLPT